MSQEVEKGSPSDDDAEGKMSKPKFIYAAFTSATWIILIHELLERFSFYGMKGILTYYMNDYLGFDEDTATIIYHLFVAISYLMPIFGTFLSDNFLGRYKTIVIVGIIYLIGHIMMPLTAMVKNVLGPLIAMLILAVGSGGIKPCVGAFGGDQIEPGNEELLDAFFSVFYMCINIGAFASTMITPVLREQVKCIDNSCYPLGFGVPAIAFGLCYALFLAGTPKYKIYPKPTSPMLNKAVGVIFSGKLRAKNNAHTDESKETDESKAERAFTEDVRTAVQVCFLFLPFPIYWALFDQQGSRWVLQGKRMDVYITESFSITPDQMQSVNPLLIVLVVPIFNNIIYPLFAKCNVLKSPTSRIFWGYLICSASFVVTGVMDVLVDSTVPVGLPAHQAQLRVYNANPCPITVGLPAGIKELGPRTLEQYNQPGWQISITNTSHGDVGNFMNVTRLCGATEPQSVQLWLRPGMEHLVIVSDRGRVSDALPVPATVSQSRLRLVHSDPDLDGQPVRFGTEPGRCLPAGNLTSSGLGGLYATGYCEIATRLDVPMYLNGENKYTVPLASGAAIKYVTVFGEFNSTDNSTQYQIITDRELSPLHIALQLPQYLLMCISEVLFSISALAFAYSEAPESLKALLQSAYLVSIFFGNIIVIAVAALPKLPKQAYEFFLFAGLVFLGGFLQLLVIRIYKKMKAKNNKVEPLSIELAPSDSEGKPNEESGEKSPDQSDEKSPEQSDEKSPEQSDDNGKDNGNSDENTQSETTAV